MDASGQALSSNRMRAEWIMRPIIDPKSFKLVHCHPVNNQLENPINWITVNPDWWIFNNVFFCLFFVVSSTFEFNFHNVLCNQISMVSRARQGKQSFFADRIASTIWKIINTLSLAYPSPGEPFICLFEYFMSNSTIFQRFTAVVLVELWNLILAKWSFRWWRSPRRLYTFAFGSLCIGRVCWCGTV